MRKFLYILVVVLMGGVFSLSAQRNALADYRFGSYLLGKGLMRDAATLTHTLADDYTPAALDTMRYLKGWTLYQMQDFRSASNALSEVGISSSFYPKSTFYGVICDLEVGNVEGAKCRLDRLALSPHAADYRELLAFERSGIALLEGNYAAYEEQSKDFSYSHFALAGEQQALDRIAQNRPKELSPWVAGVASAIVPGLGKIYAGNVGEGVASFLLVGAFAALTADSWAKADTPANWRTITYGTIGSLLYIGNIFGSVASVKVYYKNFEEINRQAVMYSIHIPLRDIFD